MLSWKSNGLGALIQTHWTPLDTHTAEINERLTINRQQSRSLEERKCLRSRAGESAGLDLVLKECVNVFLTSVARLSRISTVTLAVRLAQARHSTFAVFTPRQTAGVRRILVLLVTQHASKTRLAAAGVWVGVDRKAGTVDTPEDGETG